MVRQYCNTTVRAKVCANILEVASELRQQQEEEKRGLKFSRSEVVCTMKLKVFVVAPKASTQMGNRKPVIIEMGETLNHLNAGITSTFSDNLTWMAFIVSHVDVDIKSD